MNHTEIEFKLRAFISSKCGGKYTIARKALKTLLKATGLIEVYAFETAPASSEDTQSAYLEYVDQSNLCIFLIDNEDGVPPAVLSEEKRAKAKGLRLIYIFCDETKKEKTPTQIEIQHSLSCKYDTAHEFSDMVNKAYDAVLQDLIAIYRRKENYFTEIERDETQAVAQTAISASIRETYSLPKDRFPASAYITQALKQGILPVIPSEKVSEASTLERCLATQLNVVLNRAAFDETVFKMLRDEVLAAQDPAVKELIGKRLEAQLLYFKADYENCLGILQEALSIAINNNCIPTWLANDVAIDIRHVFSRIDDLNNRISRDNPGQKHIDESAESVYFPYLDRQVENMQEAIANRYYSELAASPYSTQYGGLDEMFKTLTNAFCIAQMHGSIIQTVICKDRLISIMTMLCSLYDDHDFVAELIRLLIVNQDSKKLDSLIRTYNQSIEIISDADVKRILDSVLCIHDQIRLYKSKYLLVSRLGYYMDDDLYQDICDDLTENAMNWGQSEKPVISISSFIFDFYKETTHRANLEQTIDFVRTIFDNRKARFYHDCFQVLQYIDFSRVSVEGQRKTRTLLIGILSGRIKCDTDYAVLSACTRFCKSATVPFKQIEKNIAKKHPNYYKETFELEMSLVRNDDPAKYISIYLTEANSRNKSQGENGQYTGYSYEPFDVIYSIISYSDYHVDIQMLNDLLNSALGTLSAEKQTVSAKASAIKMLQLLFFREGNMVAWKTCKKQIIRNKARYTSGYEMDFFNRDSLSVLAFAYDLLVSCFDPKYNYIVIEDVFCLDQRDSLSIIRCLNSISNYLEIGIGNILSVKILESFLHFSILMAQNRERDIKYYATKCLIGLTRFESTRDLAIMHLSQIMNTGSQAAKIAILTRVGQINCEEASFVEQILNKGRIDSNYLVRLVAERESKKVTH